MQTLLNNYHEITIDTRLENKANRTGFTILEFFSKRLYIKQDFRQRKRNHTKTLSSSRDTYKQVAPLESTFHKESNKI